MSYKNSASFAKYVAASKIDLYKELSKVLCYNTFEDLLNDLKLELRNGVLVLMSGVEAMKLENE